MESDKGRVLGRASAFEPAVMLACALALVLAASTAPAWAGTSSGKAEECTMIDFFEWILENEDFDSEQQADIEQAIAWLDGSGDKADRYEEFVEIGVGSTSLEGILNGASHRATMNSIREVNDLNDPEINMSAMASAALNCYCSSGLGFLSHSADYGIGQECIASGSGIYRGATETNIDGGGSGLFWFYCYTYGKALYVAGETSSSSVGHW